MKKSVVSRELAPPCNLCSEFMITLSDREMLYVTGIFNGQYLMAKIPVPSRLVLTIRRLAANGESGAHVVLVRGKTVAPVRRFLPR